MLGLSFLLALLACLPLLEARCENNRCLRNARNDPRASAVCAAILTRERGHVEARPIGWGCDDDMRSITSACSCYMASATSSAKLANNSSILILSTSTPPVNVWNTTSTSVPKSHATPYLRAPSATTTRTTISSEAAPTPQGIASSTATVTVTVTINESPTSLPTATNGCSTSPQAHADYGRIRIAPRVMIISLFTPEAAVWQDPMNLTRPIAVPGLSPLFPTILCSPDGLICQVTTGEGEINAAVTMTALLSNGQFDLTHTYFLIAGISGINPACGTIGGVAIAHFAVQVGLSYEVDAREIEDNYTSGYIPLGGKEPGSYPVYLYGTEAFELSTALQQKAFAAASKASLNDSAAAQTYRAKFPSSPANQPPTVFKGDVVTSDVYWHGELLASVFDNYTSLLTNSSGHYCMTAQEDGAILEALIRGAAAATVDFARIILMRTASNFDRPPPGLSPLQQLLYINQGGFPNAVANIYQAGHLIVEDILQNWDAEYKLGLEAENYLGDVFGTIKGQAYTQSIGYVTGMIA